MAGRLSPHSANRLAALPNRTALPAGPRDFGVRNPRPADSTLPTPDSTCPVSRSRGEPRRRHATSLRRRARGGLVLAITFLLFALSPSPRAAEVRLLNVSFDVSRSLFADLNPAFAEHWKRATGDTVVVQQSHGGSSKQARSVLEGLEADVVTLNQAADIEILARRGGLVADHWREQFPHQASPFSSTIVFLVRAGNPRGIRDWADLARTDIRVTLPNPRTSGNGRYSYLTAWVYARRTLHLDDAGTREFVGRILRNVPVSDTGGRGATTSFVEREIGDVLPTFEAEARFTLQEFGTNRLAVVYPSLSIEAEMPVAVIERSVRRHGTEKLARAYLEYLYSDAAQEIIARHHFRPRSDEVARRHAADLPPVTRFRLEEALGSWLEVIRSHFDSGGILEQLSGPPH